MIQIDKISSLYSNTIVQVDDESIGKDLNNNIKDVLILHDSNESSMTEDVRKMLGNLIQALGVDAKDVTIVYVDQTMQLSGIRDKLMDKKIVVFGLSPESLSLQIVPKHHLVHRFQDFSILFSYTLTELMLHPNMKRELWSALKDQFELK